MRGLAKAVYNSVHIRRTPTPVAPGLMSDISQAMPVCAAGINSTSLLDSNNEQRAWIRPRGNKYGTNDEGPNDPYGANRMFQGTAYRSVRRPTCSTRAFALDVQPHVGERRGVSATLVSGPPGAVVAV